MGTGTATQGPGTILHVRGTWSARDDRMASAVWLGLLWLGMIAGFGLDIPRFLDEKPAAPPVLHVHAAAFSVWMLLLTAQVLLVLRDRVAWHRKFGWFVAGWACLMAVMGPWAAMASLARSVNTPDENSPFLSVNLVDIAGFLVLLAWGIALRRNPAAHRRMMIVATISLADPGFARFFRLFVACGTAFRPVVVLLHLLRECVADCADGGLGLAAREARAVVRGGSGGVIGGGVGCHTPGLLGTVEDRNAQLGSGVGEAFQLEIRGEIRGCEIRTSRCVTETCILGI
jgi:hypothetical protein